MFAKLDNGSGRISQTRKSLYISYTSKLINIKKHSVTELHCLASLFPPALQEYPLLKVGSICYSEFQRKVDCTPLSLWFHPKHRAPCARHKWLLVYMTHLLILANQACFRPFGKPAPVTIQRWCLKSLTTPMLKTWYSFCKRLGGRLGLVKNYCLSKRFKDWLLEVTSSTITSNLLRQ